MERELMREELKRLVFNMLDAIYKEGKAPINEVNFTVNCLEALIGKDFTAEESAKAFGLLYNIVKKAANK